MTVVLEAGAVQAGDVAGGMAQVSAAVAAGLRQLGSEVGRAVDEHVVRSLATNARVRLAVKTAAV